MDYLKTQINNFLHYQQTNLFDLKKNLEKIFTATVTKNLKVVTEKTKAAWNFFCGLSTFPAPAVKENIKASSPKSFEKTKQTRSATEGIATEKLQTFFLPDGSISIIRPAKPFENCALQGGGAKGLCLPAFISSLNENMPFLENLKEIAGTSAGSTMAFLLASGLSPEEIDNFLSTINITEQLIGKDISNITLGNGIFSGNNLIRNLHELTIRSVNRYIKELKENHPEKLQKIALESGYASFMERVNSSFDEGITFNDLRLLHILEPKKFKLLHMTGYNTKEQKTVYYNAKTTPDMYCYTACRASIAIPYFFKSVVVNSTDYQDGGLGSNLPLEVFSDRENYNPETTMALVFDKNGKANKIIHNPAKPVEYTEPGLLTKIFYKILGIKQPKTGLRRTSPPSLLTTLVAGPHFAETKENDAEKMHSKGPGVFVVPHHKLKTLSFVASSERINKAKCIAKQAGEEYGNLYSNRASHTIYKTAKEAFDSLSTDEKDALKPLAQKAKTQTPLLKTQKEFYTALTPKPFHEAMTSDV